MDGQKAITDCLRIGDYIVIKSMKFDSFMIADGLLMDDLEVKPRDSIECFEDSLFCIYLQRQYSAAREYDEYMEALATRKEDALDKVELALKTGKDNENSLNDNYMAQHMGKPVHFGDVVQLLHVKSGKFVTVVPDKLASQERENIYVTLSKGGNVYSWLQIVPRYRIDKEGDKILSHKEVHIKVAQRHNEFIHCSDVSVSEGKPREANCSLETTSWKLAAFQTVKDVSDPNLIQASQIVIINDPEARANLTVVDDPPDQDVDGNDISTGNERVVVQPTLSGALDVNSVSLWVIESRNVIQGGPLQWKTVDNVRFRNLNTGKYLRMAERNGDYGLSLAGSTSSPGTLFTLHELYGNSLFLSNSKAMQVSQGGVYLTRGQNTDETNCYVCGGTKDKSKSASLLIRRYVPKIRIDDVDENNAVKSIEEPLDVFVGVTACKYLNYYRSIMVIPRTDAEFAVGRLWPNHKTDTLLDFIAILDKLLLFVKGLSMSESLEQQLHVKVKPNLKKSRQNLFMDQGVLDSLVQILDDLILVSVDAEERPKSKRKANARGESRKAIKKIAKVVSQTVFKLLYHCMENNSRAQIVVADSMTTLLAYVAQEPLAAKSVTEMLSTNLELQETKIGPREISTFVEMLRSSKMNAMYLNLLRACCSCMGQGIDGNQCTISEVLFEDISDIIIQVHRDTSRVTKVLWDFEETGMYIPLTTEIGSPIHGSSLLEEGIPHLSLSWTTKSIDYSPLGLFGKLSVSLHDLYPPVQKVGDPSTMDWLEFKQLQKSGGAGGVLANTKKQSVAEYFIAELFLAAEMCLDRNYLAMEKLEALFPYEVLVSMIKMDLNNSLKAAAVKLILCLYVDRDPQIILTIPCLTRTWTEISADGPPPLPYVETARKNYFSLLQQMISEHILDMQNKRWDDISLPMMQMLRSLIMFNFYGTTEKLNDVIKPLLVALDRRNVPVSADMLQTFDATKSIKKKKVPLLASTNQEEKSLVFEELTGKSEEEKDGSTSLLDHRDTSGEETGKIMENKVRWQNTTLDFLESLPSICFIVGLVLAAIAVAIYQVLTKTESFRLFVFDIVVTGIFIAEIILKFYCFVDVNKNFTKFFTILNNIDIFVITIDLIVYAIPTVGASGGSFVKVLRIARLVRLIRVIRAARVIHALQNLEEVVEPKWVMPVRYLKTPHNELETMVEVVNILSYIQQIIEDRNISLLLQCFQGWQSGADTRSPGEIFEHVILNSKDLSLKTSSFDDVFMDTMMFVHVELVQVALDVLMACHSQRNVLFMNIQKMQLLVTPQRERQFKLIRNMVQQLERNAETHELWGMLETEEDNRINKQTFDHTVELLNYCRIRSKVLIFDEDYLPDVDTQNLLRNLGFLDISFKILGLLPAVNDVPSDDQDDDVSINTRNMICMCNNLLYWFLKGNADNQALCYDRMDFFLDSLDRRINSHKVIQALFYKNEDLMRLCPVSLIEVYSDMICKNGRCPQYLAVASSVTHFGDKNILEKQYEIVKQLMFPGRVQKMTNFCCPKGSPEYEERVRLMKPFKNAGDVSIEDLPLELGYHCEFLRVMSGCTVGRTNITTVEAKVQSLYSYQDCIDAMLDPATIPVVNTRLCLLLFNAMIEVEISIVGLNVDPVIWKLFKSFINVFDKAALDLHNIEENGWEGSGVSRQSIEYVISAAMVVGGYFQKYYDFSLFETFPRDDKPVITASEVKALMDPLYVSLKKIHDRRSQVLSANHRHYVALALDSMRRYSPEITAKYETIIVEDIVNESEVESTAGTDEKTIDLVIAGQFDEFVTALKEDEPLNESIKTENHDFVDYVNNLPFLSDNVVADIRYQPLIRKLVQHVRDRLVVIGNDEKRLDARCTASTTWIIRSFRTMIEKKWGMSIYERDDDGGEEEDEACAPVVDALNSCGATTLCLDLISRGIDSGLVLECVKLCVAMLFKEGGNLMVQETMFDYLNRTNSTIFFKQLRHSLQNLIDWHKWHDVILLAEDEDVNLPEEVVVVRFMQLMCEGHYKKNQDIMREQPNNRSSVNLLDDLVIYLNTVSRIVCRTSTDSAIRVSATILEVIQGPCELNQEHFALNTELIETLNRIMRSKTIRDCVDEEEVELKKTAIDIFQGLLEGQGRKNAVYDRVLSVAHLDAIQILCQPDEDYGEEDEEEEEEESEEVTILRVECLVLLQMLCDYKPSLREELEFSKDVVSVKGTDVASVEILWNGELQRRFFHVPKICNDLAKASKDALVEHVDRSNQENKLLDFIYRSRELYREIKHQQLLKEYKVSGLFSRSNQDKATWLSLLLAIVINGILIGYYRLDNGEPTLSPEIESVVNALNIFQIAFSSFTLILFLVVRVPIKYQSNMAAGYDTLHTIMYTASDPMTVYYTMYLVTSILGYSVSYFFLSLLLLDILVKNSTARDVLMAVVYPRKQLAMTLVLTLFVVYIFSFIIFFNYRDQFTLEDGLRHNSCTTLFSCYKVTLGNGLRMAGGIGEIFIHSLDDRFILDVLFSLIVLIVLLNVMFGIIIDTFGELRAQKAERIEDTTGVCFICGIEKQVFDRASDGVHGFGDHIKKDHHMWNYLYFIIYVWEQDKDDDDGLEQFVRHKIDANDIVWFPMNKAMRLTVVQSDEEDLYNDLKADILASEKSMHSKFSQFQQEISRSLSEVAEVVCLPTGSVESSVVMEGEEMLDEIMKKTNDFVNTTARDMIDSHSKSTHSDDDECTLESQADSQVNYPHWKSIKLKILDIQGLNSPEKELSSVSCRMICENGMFSVACLNATTERVTFQPSEYVICDRAKLDDGRSVRIQILQGTGRVAQFVAVVDLVYSDLIASSDLVLESIFTQPGNNRSCILSVYASIENASDEM